MEKIAKLTDISAIMDAKFGRVGSPERETFEAKARAYFEAQDQTNTRGEQLTDFSAMIAAEFGEKGTPQRANFDEEARKYYNSQLSSESRPPIG